jgi:deoxyribose-phosphate aldolase
VGTVIAFPVGQDTQESKVFAAVDAARRGADELDVSMNVGWLKAGKSDQVLEEMKSVAEAAKSARGQVLVKFIIETGLLTEGEIKKACELVVMSGADFVKTCSGWGPRGAKIKDIRLIKEVVGDQVRIKAAGGIHRFQEAKRFIEAGTHRIGTSKAVGIVKKTSKIRKEK